MKRFTLIPKQHGLMVHPGVASVIVLCLPWVIRCWLLSVMRGAPQLPWEQPPRLS